MDLPNIFNKAVAESIVERINQLTPSTQPQRGVMSAAQMLAHCNVTYEMVYTNKHPKPGFFMRLVLKWMVKQQVVTDKPYPKSSRTAPAFIITDEKNFETEKERLIAYVRQTQVLGASAFDGKASHSFGILDANEWNNMFYKHLDHHLKQFGY